MFLFPSISPRVSFAFRALVYVAGAVALAIYCGCWGAVVFGLWGLVAVTLFSCAPLTYWQALTLFLAARLGLYVAKKNFKK